MSVWYNISIGLHYCVYVNGMNQRACSYQFLTIRCMIVVANINSRLRLSSLCMQQRWWPRAALPASHRRLNHFCCWLFKGLQFACRLCAVSTCIRRFYGVLSTQTLSTDVIRTCLMLVCRSTATAHWRRQLYKALGHVLLDFQLFNFSGYFRAAQNSDNGCLLRKNILAYSFVTVYCVNFFDSFVCHP